ncbi:hypothetical protein COJ07_22250 [Bacillus cereus]|uniref:Uncharacterized protein n=1 Tax=Bacillus cereus TaxID=1396 RepID=A0A2B3TVT2_BACCE|nr:hypothetical protein COJ07_22250 [Bacillus cereus]PFU38736.1 hypothetical protein COK86_24675 [Bacillus cereus]
MYVSGVGIFEDDLSEDIKFGFKDLISEGYSSEDATNVLMNTYISSLRKHKVSTLKVKMHPNDWIHFNLYIFRLINSPTCVATYSISLSISSNT